MKTAAEWSVHPSLVLVHDPVKAGALDVLRGASDLEQDFLFRSMPDISVYEREHEAFVELLRHRVGKVHYLHEIHENLPPSVKQNPNLVFTRDSVITFPWDPRFYLQAQMKEPIRAGEPSITGHILKKLGLSPVLELPPGLILEGGDAIPFSREGRRTLLIGFGPRTSFETLVFLQAHLIPDMVDEIIGLELAAWRMNLDGGFMPVSDDVAIVDSKSLVKAVILDHQGTQLVDWRSMFSDLGYKMIETTPDESVYQQSCNCVCLGNREIVYYNLCPRVATLLRQSGITVHEVAGSELIKGRGGPRCMTRPVYL